MALRCMGMRPADVMNLVQNFLNNVKRKTPFMNNRPGYTWYYSFMSRHVQKIQMRKESLLESSRSKVTTGNTRNTLTQASKNGRKPNLFHQKKFVSVFYAINIFNTIYYFKPTNFNFAFCTVCIYTQKSTRI